MKIVWDHLYMSGEDSSSVSVFVERELNGSNCMYEDGVVENTARCADNAIKAIGVLCELLAERGTLSAEEVALVVGMRKEAASHFRFSCKSQEENDDQISKDPDSI